MRETAADSFIHELLFRLYFTLHYAWVRAAALGSAIARR
jgi:hypothetical protein